MSWRNDNNNIISITLCQNPKYYSNTQRKPNRTRKSLRQRQNDNTIQTIAFTSRYLKDAVKKHSVRDLKLLAVVRGLEKISFHLYSKVVNLPADNQSLELFTKQNRAYQKNSARKTR